MRVIHATLKQKIAIKRDLDIVSDELLISLMTRFDPIDNDLLSVTQEVIEAHVEHTDEEPEKVEVTDEERPGLQMILQVLGKK